MQQRTTIKRSQEVKVLPLQSSHWLHPVGKARNCSGSVGSGGLGEESDRPTGVQLVIDGSV